ncbi:glycosyltransferase family 4 protein [bacterium]|nr:glycosyltransferase family 4 protein [bacterium]
MKILHLLYDHPNNPWLGGGGAHRAILINELLIKNHDCQVTMVCGGFKHSQSYTKEGIDFHFTPGNKNYLLSRLRFNMSCRKLVDSSKFDLVVEDTSPFAYQHVKHPKKVALFHYALGEQLLQKFPKIVGILLKKFEKFNISKYKKIIVVSKSTQDDLEKLVPATTLIKLVPPGCESQPANPIKVQDRNHFLYLGRIEFFQKGLDILLDSWGIFSKKAPSTKLIIAGSGKEEELLKSRIKELQLKNIEFIGSVGDEKFDLYKESKALLLPSRTEGWPLVLLEAFSCSTPLIGSDIPGLRNIANNSNSILVPDCNAQSFAAAMLDYTTNSTLANQLIDGAYETSKKFSWDNSTLSTFQFYSEALND